VNRNNGLRAIYMILAGAVTIGSLCFTIGAAKGRGDVITLAASLKVQEEAAQKRELRIQVLERLCERWDERWTNLQGWMARIDAKLEHMKE